MEGFGGQEEEGVEGVGEEEGAEEGRISGQDLKDTSIASLLSRQTRSL